MEKSELTIFVNHMCEMQRQQFHAIQDLTLGLAALQRLMEDHGHPNFQAEHHAKIRELRLGELGKKIAQNTAAFDKALSLAKASLL
jgi:hypothetical protein